MIVTKLFEVRDAGTFISAIAIKMVPLPFLDQDISGEEYILSRAGWKHLQEDPTSWPCVLFGPAGHGVMRYNPSEWAGNRSMQVAHEHVEINWDLLKSGDVIDVEFLLGESKEQKVSERFPVQETLEWQVNSLEWQVNPASGLEIKEPSEERPF